MVEEAESETEKFGSNTRLINDQEPVLLVTPTTRETKFVTVARQAVVRAICEIPILVSTQSLSGIEVVPHEIAANSHACIMAKSIMYVYRLRRFYITIGNLGKIEVHLLKHRKNGEVAVETVRIKDRCSSYPSGAHANNNDS